MKVIGTRPVVLMAVITEWLFGGHPRKLKRFHQPVHSSNTDVYAIITLKDIGNLVGAKPFVVIGIDLKDEPGNFLVFLCTIGRFRTVMLVISAPVDTEDFTKNFDVMLKAQLMDCI